MLNRESFLLAGHRNPDEDCVASLVAFSLLLGKFNKQNAVVLNRDNWAKYPYLLNICKYNSIRVIGSADEIGSGYDTLIAFDTPKPEMLDFKKTLDELMKKNDVLVMEIDHHLEADGTYIGDEGYRLVDEASSTCELIGYLAVKIEKKKNLMRTLGSSDIFSRNFVLSIVTGIVGDSKMGQYLKSRREKRYYRYFSRLFNEMLIRKTDKDSGNFSSIEDILMELDRLSSDEEACYQEFLKYKKNTGRMAWIALDIPAMEPIQNRFDYEVIVTVAKYAANLLAEESGYLSLVAFYDPPVRSNFIQMRMRRSGSFKELDLREVISHLKITNGGGHEGAVGFRVPRAEVQDFESFIADIIDKTMKLLGNP
jgi:nanoRNase/pAp phosphatase (c-di-AMP/oligoRNAs hydrolase)